MAKINVLSKSIAELIAAGEVVERPASVIKELVENSIDAKATAITVEIRNGGITYIRITDNGTGIEKDDVRNAFVSHATSKLSKAEDLNSIFTLGFRGEALASIAAVSKTELLTKTPSEDVGTSFAIEGGIETRNEDAGCPNGTTIVVRDLFYNTPARMKFMKRDVSEANAVADVVDKLALSHPEISFRFIREGKQTLITPGDNKLISTIYSIFGRAFSDNMLEVKYTLDGISVYGYVCKPAYSRPSRSMQYFFLNGRYVRTRSCLASMENAYKNSIMVGKFPSCVLNITVPANTIDINVHPAKTEVRFSDERKVSSAVYYAVKTALNTLDTAVQVDVNRLAKLTEKARDESVQFRMVEEEPAEASKNNQQPHKKQKDFWNNMTASQFKENLGVSSVKTDNIHLENKNEPDLIKSFKEKKAKEQVEVFEKKVPEPIEKKAENIQSVKPQQEQNKEKDVKISAQEPLAKPKPLRLLGEAFKTYIICEYDGKICLIDKHAAHERIIFNKMVASRNENEPAQLLLDPVAVTLNKNEYSVILENLDVLKKAGFGAEDFGSGVVLVRECPMLLDSSDVEDTVAEIAVYLSENRTNIETQKIDKIYHTAACKAAIKAGYKNSTAEMKVLAEAVLYDDKVRYCPHGRPVLIEMSKYELEKQFGRIQ